tara:strand:+ start:1920 stop:2447 length:528 start_codon:yes stop_codon:yes gene_type:complete
MAMWKREESSDTKPSVSKNDGALDSAPENIVDQVSDQRNRGLVNREVINIGKSVIVTGELTGSEDLTIEGQVEGKIELNQNILTIGPNGKISADIFAKSVVVMGKVKGDITASEKIHLRENGFVDGDLSAPRVAIAEGAHFRGSIDMQRKDASVQEKKQLSRPPSPSSPAAQVVK